MYIYIYIYTICINNNNNNNNMYNIYIYIYKEIGVCSVLAAPRGRLLLLGVALLQPVLGPG